MRTHPINRVRVRVPSRLRLTAALLPVFLVACGGQTPRDLPELVVVDDAPIIGALVEDRDGASGAQQAISVGGGRYLFPVNPVLPVKITSRNIVGSDGRVNVGSLDGAWYSYTDTNGNGRLDESEPKQPLTFQDLDGNGLYTQSVDLVYNGSFQVQYVPDGATTIQANVVASLIPANWNGVSSVAGLSREALNAAVTTGPSQSDNAELQRATAALTAISEGLLSTLKSSGASTSTAAAQDTISSALAGLSASAAQIDLNATDTASVAKLAQTVAQAVPTAVQTQATNLVSNVKSVQSAASPTTAPESIVKVTQERLDEFTATLDASGQQTLASDVGLAVSAIEVAKEQAVPNVDPDTLRIASLRLVPLGLPDPVTEQSSGVKVPETWIDLTATRNFSLARQDNGALTFSASGEPFQTVLGATSRTIPFVSASNSWEYTGSGGESLKIRINFSVPLFNALGGTDAGALPGVSLLQLCSAAGTCAFYILGTPTQLCSPDWAVLANTWNDVSSSADQSFYSAVDTVNRSAINCGG